MTVMEDSFIPNTSSITTRRRRHRGDLPNSRVRRIVNEGDELEEEGRNDDGMFGERNDDAISKENRIIENNFNENGGMRDKGGPKGKKRKPFGLLSPNKQNKQKEDPPTSGESNKKNARRIRRRRSASLSPSRFHSFQKIRLGQQKEVPFEIYRDDSHLLNYRRKENSEEEDEETWGNPLQIRTSDEFISPLRKFTKFTDFKQIPEEQKNAETHQPAKQAKSRHSVEFCQPNGEILNDPPTASRRTSVQLDRSTQFAPIPSPRSLKYWYDLAITNIITSPITSEHSRTQASASPSGHVDTHQMILIKTGRTWLLSLEDVLIPAMADEEIKILKKIQGKAQRRRSSYYKQLTIPADLLVDILKASRLSVMSCTANTMDAVKCSRLARQQLRHNLYLQEKERQKLERQKRKQERQEAKRRGIEKQRRMRKRRKEKRKVEATRNLPKNKDLWREVARLMNDLNKLQKEESLWKDAEILLDEWEQDLEASHLAKKDTFIEDYSTSADPVFKNDIDEKLRGAIEQMKVSVDQIHDHNTTNIGPLIQSSDDIRKNLYEKYRKEHKYRDWQGANDLWNPKQMLRSWMTEVDDDETSK